MKRRRTLADEIAISWILILFAASLLMLFLAFAPPARCLWCTPTFCAADSDCPTGCSCAIPTGEIHGECSG